MASKTSLGTTSSYSLTAADSDGFSLPVRMVALVGYP